MNSPQLTEVRLRGLWAVCNLRRQILVSCGEFIRCLPLLSEHLPKPIPARWRAFGVD